MSMSEFDSYMREKAQASALVKLKKEMEAFGSEYTNKKAEADQRTRMNIIRDEVAHKAVLDAMKLEEEITGWIEDQPRPRLEKMLKDDNTLWFVGENKPKCIATHITEYLEFLDRCDEEKIAQEDQRKTNPSWGIFG